MDRIRRAAGLGWVAVGVVFQLGVAFNGAPTPGPITLVLAVLAVLLAAATLLGRGYPLARVTAVALGLDLAGAVADRFGAFGGPGASGVSWGSWPAFVDYTALLLPGLPSWAVSLAAVLATAAEVALACLLVSGRHARWVGKATAGLFAIYLVAMWSALGLEAVAEYALPLLIGAALLVSATQRRPACPARPARATTGPEVGSVRG